MELSSGKKNKAIWATYVISVLDLTGMFLQFSVTPFLAKRMGFDTLWQGYLRMMIGALQLLGGPIFGRFADLFGARAAMSLACVASVVSFLLLVITETPAMLFIQKLPTFFMHVLPVSQMVVTDLSEPGERAKSLSQIGMCFGVGMITGSLLGGHLSTHLGEKLTACVGAGLSLLSLLLTLIFIPKTTKSPSTAKTSSEAEKKSLFNFGEITRLLKYPGVAHTLVVKIVGGFPQGIFQMMFPIVALEVFELGPKENGYLMSFFGVAQIGIQGGVIGRLTASFRERTLLLWSIAGAAVVGLGQGYTQTAVQFSILSIPMMLSMTTFAVITESILTKCVPSSDSGTMLGMCASVMALTRTFAPTVGGYLFLNGGLVALGLTQTLVNALVFIALLLWPLTIHRHTSHED